MRYLPMLLLLWIAAPIQAAAQRPSVPGGMHANFPPVPELWMQEEVRGFRAEVEARIETARPQLGRGAGVIALTDSLLAAWRRFGDRLVEERGDFHQMHRGGAYWLLTTDEAADTLTDRLGLVLERYVKAHPEESLGPARVQWEIGAENLGVPKNRLFGFQFVELATRGGALRRSLIEAGPKDEAVLFDAYLRFLWDLVQFYRQLHSGWFERHGMRVAQEDWIIHRLVGKCKDPRWNTILSLTGVGVDTTSTDPMTDKFMHRLVVVDPACPDTIDFVVPLPHYRLMEQQLNKMSEIQRQKIIDRILGSEDKPKRPAGTGEGERKP